MSVGAPASATDSVPPVVAAGSSGAFASGHTLIIFGGSGDLAARKLVPALYNLGQNDLLPEPLAVVGLGRRAMDDESYRERLRTATCEFSRTGAPDDDRWAAFERGLYYGRGDFGALAGYEYLKERLRAIEEQHATSGNRIFYLATPPSLFPGIIRLLGESGLNKGSGTTRIVIEKPFGRDLATAQALNEISNCVFDESQIYRIDHYLGKETVQNVLIMRFANVMFEPVWNRQYVDSVQITVSETDGLEGRGTYYEEAGALRDVVQNHIMQMLAVIAMEPPVNFEADSIRDEKVKVIRALRKMTQGDVRSHVVRASYGEGVLKGREVPAYRDEDGVTAGSQTETYVAARLFIDNWRWKGVPFYLRSGKRLAKRATEIAIQFKEVPHLLFGMSNPEGVPPNVLAIRIQPDEGISITFEAKEPGPAMRVQPVKMDFGYGESFSQVSPDAYERLLLDVLLGDQTLFIRRDETEAAWGAVMPILDAWGANADSPLDTYVAGSWGPRSAGDLLRDDGFRWRRF
jgi:glucose-6-phosphate 1-dehydrogenase